MNIIARVLSYPALIILAVLATGCGDGASVSKSGPLRVVATTSMIADAVKQIAGDKVELYGLMGPGVDPHLFRPSKGDIDKLNEADVIFYNGLYLEAKMVAAIEKMQSGKQTIAVGEAVPDSLLEHPADFEGHPDPHVWFDLSLWHYAVDTIGGLLAQVDSANAAFYRANRAALLDSISQLDAWVRQSIASIPEDRRILVTAHDAFGYFGRAYGIEVRGLQGISTVTEAGLYDVTSMVDMLVQRRVPAVFVESSVPRKAIEAVVEGCREQGHDVRIGGELYSDAMGPEASDAGTYLGMVRHNVTTVVEALAEKE